MGNQQGNTHIDVTLDAIGLKCPMPTVKTAIALDKMQKGQILEVIVDDLTSCRDLPRWVHTTAYKLISVNDDGKIGHIIIEK